MPLGGARIESPLKTVDFLDGYADILGRRFEGSSPEDLLDSSGKYTPFPVSRVNKLLQISHRYFLKLEKLP